MLPALSVAVTFMVTVREPKRWLARSRLALVVAGAERSPKSIRIEASPDPFGGRALVARASILSVPVPLTFTVSFGGVPSIRSASGAEAADWPRRSTTATCQR